MAGAIRVDKDFPPEFQTWEPMSIDLRSQWCKQMLFHPPIHLGNTVMSGITQATNISGWHTSRDWIELAKEFDAIGFTPDEFGELNRAVKADTRSRPIGDHETDGDTRYVSNSLITLGEGNKYGPTIRLRASDWVEYLARVRAGGSPQTLVDEILAAHWGEPAETIVD